MFHSGLEAECLINQIENETNLNFPVSREIMCSWLNMTEQLLYSDVVREMRSASVDFSHNIPLCELPFDGECEDFPRFSDICGIFAVSPDGERIELEQTTPLNMLRGVQRDLSYCFDGGVIRFSDDLTSVSDKFAGNKLRCREVIILRYVRPAPKSVISGRVIGEIMLPPEFCELIACRLRGEKYRLIGDDVLCAKWIGEYNSVLASFADFVSARRVQV